MSRYTLLVHANESNSNIAVEVAAAIEKTTIDVNNLPRPSSLTTLVECQDVYVNLIKEYTTSLDNLKVAHENITATIIKMKLAKNEQSRAILALEHCKLEAENWDEISITIY
jgi:hypothetical protein